MNPSVPPVIPRAWAPSGLLGTSNISPLLSQPDVEEHTLTTRSLHDGKRQADKYVMNGACLVLLNSLTGVFLIWFGRRVPDTCNTDIGYTIEVMGVLIFVNGIAAMLCAYGVAQGTQARVDHTLYQKHKEQGRTFTAELELQRYSRRKHHMAGASSAAVGLFCLFVLSISVAFILGVLQWCVSDDRLCGSQLQSIILVLMAIVILICANQDKEKETIRALVKLYRRICTSLSGG